MMSRIKRARPYESTGTHCGISKNEALGRKKVKILRKSKKSKMKKIEIGAHVTCKLVKKFKEGAEDADKKTIIKKLHYGIIQSIVQKEESKKNIAIVKFYRQDRRGRTFHLEVNIKSLKLDENINNIKYGGIIEEVEDIIISDMKQWDYKDWGLSFSNEESTVVTKVKDILTELSISTIRDKLTTYLKKHCFDLDGKTRIKTVDPKQISQVLNLHNIIQNYPVTREIRSILTRDIVKKNFNDAMMNYLDCFII